MSRRITTRAWRDAGRILRQLERDLAHLGHGYLRRRPAVSPELVAAELVAPAPVKVTFGKPRALNGRTWDRIAPGAGSSPPSAHMVDGGWRWYQVSMPDVYCYIAAASTRKDAVGHLSLVAGVVPYSQLTLSEAVGVTLDMMSLDPRPGWGHPRFAASEWAEHGVGLIDCWQARQTRYEGRGLGDLEVLAQRVAALRGMCSLWHVQQAQIELDAAKARAEGRLLMAKKETAA